MTKLKALPKSLVAIALREDVHRTYAKYFLPSATSFTFSKKDADKFSILVPPSICRKITPTDTTASYLATSSILAFYDEMDAHSFINKDATGRGGVSVELSVDLFKEVKPWSRLVMELKTEKIGKFIGFSSVVVKDEDNNIVAKGSHSKFMDMGRLWNVMHNPWISKWLYALYYRFRYAAFTTPLDDIIHGTTTLEDSESRIRANPLFQSPEELFHANFSSFQLQSKALHLEREDADEGDAVASHTYSLNVLKQTKNYLGLMHGGGVAGAIEQACYMFKFHGDENERKWRGRLRVAKMDIKYLNATKVISSSSHDIILTITP